eukprot:Cvel_29477.t1-p1 / transcript=Cvel_29477.t1 / gene=Cvel_29477 / organism=Chromera_velia_CCMP2878 / gene_product=hypothetical protein / transcript_product=hypothetical protein / location=Cvel_scaffold4043:274-8699(+) / protein_length=883 / sequence_SO=supercontig / SO=protein_coding / is_pseudo=false
MIICLQVTVSGVGPRGGVRRDKFMKDNMCAFNWKNLVNLSNYGKIQSEDDIGSAKEESAGVRAGSCSDSGTVGQSCEDGEGVKSGEVGSRSFRRPISLFHDNNGGPLIRYGNADAEHKWAHVQGRFANSLCALPEDRLELPTRERNALLKTITSVVREIVREVLCTPALREGRFSEVRAINSRVNSMSQAELEVSLECVGGIDWETVAVRVGRHLRGSQCRWLWVTTAESGKREKEKVEEPELRVKGEQGVSDSEESVLQCEQLQQDCTERASFKEEGLKEEKEEKKKVGKGSRPRGGFQLTGQLAASLEKDVKANGVRLGALKEKFCSGARGSGSLRLCDCLVHLFRKKRIHFAPVSEEGTEQREDVSERGGSFTQRAEMTEENGAGGVGEGQNPQKEEETVDEERGAFGDMGDGSEGPSIEAASSHQIDSVVDVSGRAALILKGGKRQEPGRVMLRAEAPHRQALVWSRELDERIREWSERVGGGKWAWLEGTLRADFLLSVPNHNDLAVRWNEILDPSLCHGKFSEEECIRLLLVVRALPSLSWEAVSRLMSSDGGVTRRSREACRKRLYEILKQGDWRSRYASVAKNGSGRPWTEEEDERLRELVEVEKKRAGQGGRARGGRANWEQGIPSVSVFKRVAEQLEGRTFPSCRERWKRLQKSAPASAGAAAGTVLCEDQTEGQIPQEEEESQRGTKRRRQTESQGDVKVKTEMDTGTRAAEEFQIGFSEQVQGLPSSSAVSREVSACSLSKASPLRFAPTAVVSRQRLLSVTSSAPAVVEHPGARTSSSSSRRRNRDSQIETEPHASLAPLSALQLPPFPQTSNRIPWSLSKAAGEGDDRVASSSSALQTDPQIDRLQCSLGPWNAQTRLPEAPRPAASSA